MVHTITAATGQIFLASPYNSNPDDFFISMGDFPVGRLHIVPSSSPSISGLVWFFEMDPENNIIGEEDRFHQPFPVGLSTPAERIRHALNIIAG